MRTTPTLATLSVLALISGCTPAAPTAPPTPIAPPTQAYYCTPDGATAGAPCSKAEYDAQLARDKQYEEAEQVFRDMLVAQTALLRTGGPADDTVLRYAARDGAEIIQETHASGLQYLSGEPKVAWVKRLIAEPHEGSTLALTLCIDSSQVLMRTMDGGETTGVAGQQDVYFASVDSSLRIVYLEYEEVDGC